MVERLRGHRGVICEGDVNDAWAGRQIKLYTLRNVPAAFNQLGTTVFDVSRGVPRNDDGRCPWT